TLQGINGNRNGSLWFEMPFVLAVFPAAQMWAVRMALSLFRVRTQGPNGRRKEIAMESATWLNGDRRGRCRSSGSARLLASQNELAGALPGALLPGLPG